MFDGKIFTVNDGGHQPRVALGRGRGRCVLPLVGRSGRGCLCRGGRGALPDSYGGQRHPDGGQLHEARSMAGEDSVDALRLGQ
jgi:hypothetical protein